MSFWTLGLMERISLSFLHVIYHEVLYSTILFLFLLGPVWFLKRKTPLWQLGLWGLIFIRLVLPPDLSSSFSARRIINKLSMVGELGITIQETVKRSKGSLFAYPDTPAGLTKTYVIEKQTINPEKSDMLPNTARLFSFPIILMMFWFTGFILFFALFVKKLMRFHKVINHAMAIEEKNTIEVIDYWKKKLNIQRNVRVVSSDEYLSPFTLGTFSPKIFIPRSLIQSKQMETIHSVIAHEMVHIKHFDDLWMKFQNMVLLIYYFHPVVWYINRQMISAREYICDSAVLSRWEFSHRAYGRGIMDALRVNIIGSTSPFPAFIDHRKEVENRIRNIVKGGVMKKSNPMFVFFVIFLLGLFSLPMALGKQTLASNRSTNIGELIEVRSPIDDGVRILFNPEIHVIEKLPQVLHKKKNSNLKSPQKQLHTFQESIDIGRTPGLEYYTGKAPVRAVAAGIVHFMREGQEASGGYVRVYHDFYNGLENDFYPNVLFYRHQAYRSTYYHLSKVMVKSNQAVTRGQLIGYGMKYGSDGKEKVKIILEERGTLVNLDDYGPNHGFMDYWDGKTDYEIDLEEMNKRLDKQTQILNSFNSFYDNRNDDDIFKKIHTVEHVRDRHAFAKRYNDFPVKWSRLNKFKYLEQLYNKKPDLFPLLSENQLKEMTQDFYQNQPIVLTLPF